MEILQAEEMEDLEVAGALVAIHLMITIQARLVAMEDSEVGAAESELAPSIRKELAHLEEEMPTEQVVVEQALAVHYLSKAAM